MDRHGWHRAIHALALEVWVGAARAPLSAAPSMIPNSQRGGTPVVVYNINIVAPQTELQYTRSCIILSYASPLSAAPTMMPSGQHEGCGAPTVAVLAWYNVIARAGRTICKTSGRIFTGYHTSRPPIDSSAPLSWKRIRIISHGE